MAWDDDPLVKTSTATVKSEGWGDDPVVGGTKPAAPVKFPQDEPGYTYGNILPFRVKQDEKGQDIPGSQELAAPEMIRAPARGLEGFEKRTRLTPATPEGLHGLNPDEEALFLSAGGVRPSVAMSRTPPVPVTPSPAKLLMDEGVRLTPGQLAGGVARSIENKATSIPLTGDAIIAAQRRSIEDFNKAGYNRALAPIGEKYTGNETGYEGIKQVREKLSDAYNKVLSKVNFAKDVDFDYDLADILSRVKEIPPDQATQFEAILNNRVLKRLEPDGTLTGNKFKDVESELTTKADGFHKDRDQAVRELGDLVDDLNGALRANLVRANPDQAKELQAANRGWAMFARLRRAASNRATSGGVFTPGDLLSAAKMGDNRPGRGAFAQGEALMQDLGWAGQQVLPNTYPESGTAGRMMLGAGALGAAELLHRPELLAALGGGMLPYTRPAVAVLNKAMKLPAGPRVTDSLLPDYRALFGGTADALGARGLPGIGVVPPGSEP